MKLKFAKISFLLLSVFCSICAQTSNEKTITLNAKNANLRNVLLDVHKQSDINFIFSDKLVDSVKVSCSFENFVIDSALSAILKGTGLFYKSTQKNQVVIYKLETRKKKISISGRIIDSENGEALPYANVYVANSTYGTSANREGIFYLNEIPYEICTLKVGNIGYNTKTLVINSEQINEDTLISLTRKDLYIKSVTVKGSKNEIIKIDSRPSLNIIEVNNFSTLPSIGEKDISRSLQLLPGIATSNYGSAGLHIRNGLPSENLILLDGISLYHHNHTFGFFNAINSDAIKDVRIYKGGFPAKYGDRLSGVLELTTRTGNFSKPKIRISGNQVNFNAVGEIPIAGKGAALIAYRQSYRDKFLVDIFDRVYKTIKGNISPYHYDDEFLIDDNNNIADNVNFYDLLGKLTIVPAKDDFISFSFYSGLDKAETTSDNLQSGNDFANTFIDEKLRWDNYGFSGSWFRRWSNSINTNVLVSKSKYSTESRVIDIINFSQDFVEADTLDQEITASYVNDINDFTFQLRNELAAGQFGFWEFGLSYKEIGLFYDETYTNFETFKFSQDNTAKLTTFYIQDTFKPFENLETTLGVRSTFYNLSDKKFIEPRVSFNYKVSDNFRLKGAWGHYHQYLIKALANDAANLDGQNSWVLADGEFIKPGFSEHFIVGFQFDNDEYLFDTEVYFKENTGLDNIYGNQQFLIEDENYYGFETTTFSKGLDIIFQKKKGDINGWISYSLGESESEAERNFNKIRFPSDQDIRHNIKVVINYNTDNFVFALTWQFLSGLPYNIPDVVATIDDPEFPEFKTYTFFAPQNRNSERLPSIKKMDFSVSYLFDYKWIKGKAGFSVFNLFDNKNVWHRYFKITNGKLTPVDVYMIGFTPTLFAEINF